MSKQTADTEKTPKVALPPSSVINDFSINVATVNGSGSQTANLAIMRSLFRMGIPVSGKNLFPSNIQGLPTWFWIRVSSQGYTARTEHKQILIAMNRNTIQTDIEELPKGGVCFYPDDSKLPDSRHDITAYPMPVRDIIKKLDPPRELRDYVSNMVYVGSLAYILGIELSEIESSLISHFSGNQKPVVLNMKAIQLAYEWSGENLKKQDPYYVERDTQTENMILIDGNTAAALGSVYGGVGFVAWYPITPASSMPEQLQEFLQQLRTDPETGKANYAIIQAEDELSAAGMTIGAGWAGARSLTSTSGPGLSLMAEYVGLAFFAEIPIVIWNVQRMGPSTGLPTRTSQGDLMFTRYLGHGDTKHIMLFPNSMEESFEFGWRSLDIAEQLQTPVFVLSDLDLGMNVWMSKPFKYPDQPMNRGKILSTEDLDRIESFARYRDVDGDGIPYRTLPGNAHPNAAWFARGTGHDENARYSEDPEVWERNLERLWRKIESAPRYLPEPVQREIPGARIGLIAYGSTDPALLEAQDRLADQLPSDYLRIRSVPFNEQVSQFLQHHDRIYVVEMNIEGQMRQLLTLEYPEFAHKLQSLCKNNGLPLTAAWVEQAVLAKEQI
ncbi:MAG: 2-oxoacid:acceptor oxidoreductase subunit alpha [Anaerolineales bacterium]|nr:2-oxoacid:acceptor oxidoreductase subunit alpha [Anaerolineales bacterium]